MSNYNKKQEVVRRAVVLAVDYLLRTEFADVETKEQLADLTGMTVHNSGLVLNRQNIMAQDLLDLCDCRGINYGITLQIPGQKEVTLIPSVNFNSETSHSPFQTRQLERKASA